MSNFNFCTIEDVKSEIQKVIQTSIEDWEFPGNTSFDALCGTILSNHKENWYDGLNKEDHINTMIKDYLEYNNLNPYDYDIII